MARLPEGFQVGHWTDSQQRSGCTVVLPPPGNVTACDVRGSAPSSRELTLLDRSQQPAVPDCPDVELQRIVDRLAGVEIVRCPFALWVEERLRSVRLHGKAIGGARPPLEAFRDEE